MRLLIACSVLLLASCGIYQTDWDCPPGQGIGCKPVSEVLNLIVEKEGEADLFVSDSGTALLLKKHERKKFAVKPEEKKLFLLKEQSGQPVLVEAVVEERK